MLWTIWSSFSKSVFSSLSGKTRTVNQNNNPNVCYQLSYNSNCTCVLNTGKALFQPQNETSECSIRMLWKYCFLVEKKLEMTQELHHREQWEVEIRSLLSHFLSSGNKNKLDGCRWDCLFEIVLKMVCTIKGLDFKKEKDLKKKHKCIIYSIAVPFCSKEYKNICTVCLTFSHWLHSPLLC